MVKFYSLSTDRNTDYDFENPLEIKASELENLREILYPYLSKEDLKKVPKIHTELVNDILRPVGYRVVNAKGLTSLGLRRNPNILHYPINKWFSLPEDWIVPGPQDWGGVSIARTVGKVHWMQKYMKEKHNMETRVFKTAFEDIIHHKEWRIKTNKLLMYEEIFF
jgi:hypothetical protein